MIDVNVKFVSSAFCNPDVIPNTLTYIFNLKSKSPLPVRFYGLSDVGGYPPSYIKIIQQFQKVRANQNNISSQQVWHMIISFLTLYFIYNSNRRENFMFETYDDILAIDVLAEALKIGTTQAYKLVRSQTLKTFKEGKDWKIAKQALINYIVEQSKL